MLKARNIKCMLLSDTALYFRDLNGLKHTKESECKYHILFAKYTENVGISSTDRRQFYQWLGK